jgi:DNA-binding MarR family transcriptional regulator
VNALSEHAKHKKKALGLVEVFIDPAEGRRYRVRLTKKGQGIKQQILNLPSNGQSQKSLHKSA